MEEVYETTKTYTVYSSLYSDFMLLPYSKELKSLILFVNVEMRPNPLIIPYIFTIDDISKMVLIENRCTDPRATTYQNLVKTYWMDYFTQNPFKMDMEDLQSVPFSYYLETLNDSI
jgi:hypothetical protein